MCECILSNLQARANIRRRGKDKEQLHLNAGQIVDEELIKMSKRGGGGSLECRDALKKIVHHARQGIKRKKYEKPNSLAEFQIPEELKYVTGPDGKETLFLLYDSGNMTNISNILQIPIPLRGYSPILLIQFYMNRSLLYLPRCFSSFV